MYIEYVMDIIERLDGAGLTIENMETIEEELEAMGLCHDDDPDCEDAWGDDDDLLEEDWEELSTDETDLED